MVFCLFCHWTKVEPGTNCHNCNTYMPKSSSVPRDTYPSPPPAAIAAAET